MPNDNNSLASPSDKEEESSRTDLVTIVGVGVAAASLRSLGTLFAGISSSLGAAYLIAVRQEEGLDVASVVSLLRQQSSLAISIGRDGEWIEPNHIYIAASNDMIGITNGRLTIRQTAEPIGHRGTVDSMLISIAEHAQDRAVVVILNGMGSDGTAGVTATKKFGGLSIGEITDAADTGNMPGSSGPLGAVDLRLPVEEIAPQIVLYLNNIANTEIAIGQEPVAEQGETQITQLTTILRNITGHDFHGYKRGTFLRRVHRRLQVLQIESMEAYIKRLRADREEVQHLFQDLLIGVTQFFRDPTEFDILERELPKLFSGKGPDEQIRVWVLGCATGEEAYSIAILLREHMSTLPQPPQVQIFATDLDSRALGLARAGRYTDTIAEHIRPDRLARWFLREGDTYCVSKELREMCIFSPHNLIKDAPFSRIDLLSCRNLLIYLSTELQNRVIPIFHFSLNRGGVLFLGSSENITRHQKLFSPIDRRNRVFRRLDTATRVIPDFPLTTRARLPELTGTPTVETTAPQRLSGPVGRQAEAVAERYAPAYIVVDNQYDVLHFSGRTGRFLEPVAGLATLNLLNLVHRDLRVELRSALHRAVSEGRRIDLHRLVMRQDERVSGVNLVVEPLGSGDVTSLVVVFQDMGPLPDGNGQGDRLDNDEHVQRLEAELRLTRDRLQATIEELESTNEELKSSNEEYQSINEELQSANEEMETSKEELQSVNEELQTVNGELAHRVSELGRSNSDLKNLLEATQIATVFLDNDLRVRSFTPTATDIFHLLETDIGRPLGHVVSRVSYPDLQDDVRRVLKTLVPVDRSVVDPASERHYAAKVLPYRSVDNYISGAVVTFTDLTAVHNAELALRDSEERFRILVGSWAQAVWEAEADGCIMQDSPSWREHTGQSMAEWMDNGWLDAVHPEDSADARQQWQTALEERCSINREFRLQRPDGSWSWTNLLAAPLLNEDGTVRKWVGMNIDITARREAQEAVRESEERLHSLVEGLPQLVWRSRDLGSWTWSSPQWSAYTAQAAVDALDWGWLTVVHPHDQKAARLAWSRAQEHEGFQVEHRIRRASDGTYRWFQTRATPVRDERGAIVEWIGTSTDIHDLRDLQERQAVLVSELQHRTLNLLSIIRAMADTTLRRARGMEDFKSKFSDRLAALGRVQRLLSRLDEHDRVTFDELIRTELSAHVALDEDPDRIVLEGPSGVRLRSGMVQTLALGLHELATNAVKYGALRQPSGRLHVRWHILSDDETPRLEIIWRESGVMMPQDDMTPLGSGQGRELIEKALPYQLGAKTHYELGPDGVCCTINIPTSATTSEEAPNG